MTMEFFFPEDNLDRVSPEETEITSLTAEPYPDGRRLHVNIEMSAFLQRPHIDILITNGNGEEVASANVVEPMTFKIEFTMHLRGELKNPHTLEAKLFYPDGPSKEPKTFSFDVTPPPPEPEADSA